MFVRELCSALQSSQRAPWIIKPVAAPAIIIISISHTPAGGAILAPAPALPGRPVARASRTPLDKVDALKRRVCCRVCSRLSDQERSRALSRVGEAKVGLFMRRRRRQKAASLAAQSRDSGPRQSPICGAGERAAAGEAAASWRAKYRAPFGLRTRIGGRSDGGGASIQSRRLCFRPEPIARHRRRRRQAPFGQTAYKFNDHHASSKARPAVCADIGRSIWPQLSELGSACLVGQPN